MGGRTISLKSSEIWYASTIPSRNRRNFRRNARNADEKQKLNNFYRFVFPPPCNSPCSSIPGSISKGFNGFPISFLLSLKWNEINSPHIRTSTRYLTNVTDTTCVSLGRFLELSESGSINVVRGAKWKIALGNFLSQSVPLPLLFVSKRGPRFSGLRPSERKMKTAIFEIIYVQVFPTFISLMESNGRKDPYRW